MCDDRSRTTVAACVVLAMAFSVGHAQQTITGYGTNNYVSKFTNTYVIGNSAIYESGGLVGIGTTSPSVPLHISSGAVQTALLLQNTSAAITVNMKSSSTSGYGQALVRIGDALDLRTQDQARITILGTGHVGVGTASPTARLHVNSGTEDCVLLLVSTDPAATINLKDNATSGYGQALVRRLPLNMQPRWARM